MSSFADATAVRATSPHSYTATFTEPWCIGSVPHGGYVTSTIQRVAALHFATTLRSQLQPHTLALHLEFLRRTSVGEAVILVHHVKLGRQTSTIHVSLRQSDGRDAVVGYITQADLDAETGVSFATGWSLQPQPRPAQPLKFDSNEDPYWTVDREERFAEFRKAHSRIRRMIPRAREHRADLSWSDTWISLATVQKSASDMESREKFTNESLGFVADMFPQLIEGYLEATTQEPRLERAERTSWRAGAGYWYPTLLLNLDIKKSLPADGVDWLFVRVRAKTIKNGRYDLEVIVLDENNDLVCISNHVVMALKASRNLAKRRGEEGEPARRRQHL
ncbi:MAG: hypothetical protein M1828_006747 [Chrysothrix sp. TS-e1954]|nr:MAG: hypothetical protein M1828_006747 [Chrysothrix sp. TS-e1954]